MSTRRFWASVLAGVALIVGIAANVVLPLRHRAERRADAAAVLSVFHALRVAAQDRFARDGAYPASTAWGTVPASLEPSLPAGFSLGGRGDVEFRWRRWPLPNGLPGRPGRRVLLGVDVRTTDRALLRAVRLLHRGPIADLGERKITLVID